MTRHLILLALLAQPAAACTAGDTILSCTLRDGRYSLAVCATGDALAYVYGPADRAPDIVLAALVRAVRYRPWNGIGRTIHEEVSFDNGGFAYTAWWSVDRMLATDDPVAAETAGITVTRGDQTLAELACDPGTINAQVDRLWDLKQAAGQCHDRDAGVWRNC